MEVDNLPCSMVVISLLQNTADIHIFSAKVQKPSETAKFILIFPRRRIFIDSKEIKYKSRAKQQNSYR